MKRESIMMHYRPEERPFVDRLIDLCQRVDERQSPALTDFLDPRQVKIARAIVGTMADAALHLEGGYEGAERQRALLVPSYWQPEPEDFQVGFLRIEIPGEYVKLTHGDYLGALVGLGLKRGKLGDLSVHDDGCDLVATTDMADFIRLHLAQVGRATVHVATIEREKFVVKRAEFQEKEFTVMSLRVDSVAAEAFGLSRTKALDPIKSGKMQLNWMTIDDPSTAVEEGDVISLRGHGRIKVLEVGGQTRKGRTVLKIGKYV